MPIPDNYQATDNCLQDRIVLVTGAGDGIGRAVSIAAAKHGATVILLGKTVKKLEAVYDEIEEAGGPQPAIYPMNLEGATPTDFDQLAQTITDNFGRLDVLLHNAASLPYLSRLKDYEAEDWMKVMQVNLNTPFLLTQSCIDVLMKSEAGRILFTSDAPGHQAKPFWGAYGVSKAAIDNLAGIWGAELEKTPIDVCTIDPGPTLTALRKRVFPAEDNTQMQRAEDIVANYLYAMSADTQLETAEKIGF